jgi:protein TonB
LARAARIQGIVQLIGVIATDGTIQHLQVVSGHALLVPAAVAAVRQWRYSPTTLNGDPVEVVAPITVTFTLNN